MLLPRPFRSVRGRLALVTGLGALLLAGTTAVLLVRSSTAAVNDAVDDGLRARAADLVLSVTEGDVGLVARDTYAQLVDANGAVVTSAPAAGAEPVVGPDDLAAARRRSLVVAGAFPGLGDAGRVLLTPVEVDGATFVLAVGADASSGPRAQDGLRLVMTIGVPCVALLLAAAAWWVAGRALRPAERMARRAERISLGGPPRRLPVPPADHELARLGRRLNAMLARLEDAYEHEREFLDDASHELRTPLAILRGELELALDATDDPAAVRAAIESAIEEADRLSAITADLLTLARADARGVPLQRREVDLHAAATRVAARPAPVDASIAVEVVGDGVATVDDRRIEQILTNLVSNARRHARGHVQVRVAVDAEGAVIEVADDGPGFPEALLPRVFERFTLAKANRRREGTSTGLGLAIVRALAVAHGGEVAAANGPPLGGAVVTVRLPPPFIEANSIT